MAWSFLSFSGFMFFLFILCIENIIAFFYCVIIGRQINIEFFLDNRRHGLEKNIEFLFGIDD